MLHGRRYFSEPNAAPNTARGAFRCHLDRLCGAAMSPALQSIERPAPRRARVSAVQPVREAGAPDGRLNQVINTANTIRAAHVKNAKKEPLRKALPGLIPKLLLLASCYQEVAEHPAGRSAVRGRNVSRHPVDRAAWARRARVSAVQPVREAGAPDGRLNQIINIASTIHAAYVKNAKKEPLRQGTARLDSETPPARLLPGGRGTSAVKDMRGPVSHGALRTVDAALLPTVIRLFSACSKTSPVVYASLFA